MIVVACETKEGNNPWSSVEFTPPLAKNQAKDCRAGRHREILLGQTVAIVERILEAMFPL
jgi:hypothetical protein